MKKSIIRLIVIGLIGIVFATVSVVVGLAQDLETGEYYVSFADKIVEQPEVSPTRPNIRGMEYAVSSGHWLASKVGADILDKGGNMADAGVATVLAESVLEPNANFTLGGEGGILIYLANEQRVVLISGMGIAPKVATVDYYIEHFGGIPETIAAAAVPGIFDCLMVALDKYGTMSFEEVVQGALQLADRGFPMFRDLTYDIQRAVDRGNIFKYPESLKIYLPGGEVPQPGEIITNPGLAKLFKKFIAAERAALAQGKSRSEVMQAVRDVFYKGYVALEVDRFMKEQGEHGLLRYEDFVHYGELPKEEEPWTTNYRGYDVYSHSTWSQGPAMLQSLNVLEGFDMASLGVATPESLHIIVETLKLVLADRHAYYGDPRFSDIPKEGLLSKEYAAERRALIDLDKAAPEFAPGDPWKYQEGEGKATLPVATAQLELVDDLEGMDTTAMTLVDKNRNMFNCTPSTYGGLSRTACVPGDVGFLLNTRLLQNNLDEDSPNKIEPWKRPRLTPQSYMAIKDGKPFLAWNTPGGDQQVQIMLQAFVNVVDYGLLPQDALDIPTVRSFAFPAGQYPCGSNPYRLRVEANMPEETIEGLKELGHDVELRSPWSQTGGVMVMVEPEYNTVIGAAVRAGEKRYAIAW